MVSAQKKRPFFTAFLILAGLGVVGLGLALCTGSGAEDSSNIYKTDAPRATLPENLMPGLLPITAEQMARIPFADGFQWPVGAPNMAFMYDAQGFGADNNLRGGKHVGVDLNGIGGENTDLGEPVYAAGRGLVIYSGMPSESWGNVVVVAHRLPGSTTIYQSMYAHLNERKVKVGDVLYRGQELGTIGTGNGHYLAHLHFEFSASRVVEAGMPGYHPAGTMNRLNPADIITKHPAPAFPDPYRDVAAQLKLNSAFSAGTP